MTAAELYCGVDVGASATKLVLVDPRKAVLARVVKHSGVDYDATAKECLAEALVVAGSTVPPARTVSTGYGRHNVSFADTSLTEINCHGVGCFHEHPRAMTVVDIGGQDNKIIHLSDEGRPNRFRMNRKCAAGTGAFIEEIALRLNLRIEEMDPLAKSAAEPVKIGSFCTVFTKTEILAHLRRGEPVAGIVRGAFISVIDRVVEMDPLDGDIVMSGGVVAHNPTIAEILSKKVNKQVEVAPHPQFTGALGAALMALKQTPHA